MFDLKKEKKEDYNVLKPGLNKVSVQFNLVTKDDKNDIVINFKKSKEVKVALWLNNPENKIFEESVTANNKVMTAEFKKVLYENAVITALRQVFNAVVGNETEWVAMSNSVEGKLTMAELYDTIKGYLEDKHPDYWKKQVYVALTQYKNNLRVACLVQGKNGNWYPDESFNTKFVSDVPFEPVHVEEYKADEIEMVAGDTPEDDAAAKATADW